MQYKACREEGELEGAAMLGLTQIIEKKYERRFKNFHYIQEYVRLGISFFVKFAEIAYDRRSLTEILNNPYKQFDQLIGNTYEGGFFTLNETRKIIESKKLKGVDAARVAEIITGTISFTNIKKIIVSSLENYMMDPSTVIQAITTKLVKKKVLKTNKNANDGQTTLVLKTPTKEGTGLKDQSEISTTSCQIKRSESEIIPKNQK